MFLPVTHRLAEDGSLAACEGFEKKKSKKKQKQLNKVPDGDSPLKFPLMTYGMMPSGHTRSGLEVAALLRRPRPRPPLAATQGDTVGSSDLPAEVSERRVTLPGSVWLAGLWARRLNMRRSSSSRAMSPQKAAGEKTRDLNRDQ